MSSSTQPGGSGFDVTANSTGLLLFRLGATETAK
jgi:hypothetical protein